MAASVTTIDTVEPALRIVSDAQIAQINNGQMVASDTGPTIAGVKADNLLQYLHELTQAVTKGQLAPEKLAEGVKCAGVVAEDCGTALTDVLWLSWAEASIEAPLNIANSTEWVTTAIAEDGPVLRLASLAKELQKQQLVTKAQLKETGDSEFLAAAGLVVSAAVWHRKGVRVNTKNVYQQQKFNLLREESEGYAKLLTALNRVGDAAVSESSAPGLVAEVKGLVGYFDLDPNRVASLSLQALSAQPAKTAYLPLFDLFTQACVEQTLGFLFQHHSGSGGNTPDSLFAAAEVLIQAGVVRLEAIMSHLTPSDPVMRQAASAASASLDKQISNIGVISLSATSTEQSRPAGELNRIGPVLTSSTLQLDVRPMATAAGRLVTANNQKLGLLAALLRAGCWEEGSKVMGWLSAVGADPVAHVPVAAAISSEVHALLQPLLSLAYPGGATSRYALDSRGRRPSKTPLLEPLLLQRLALLGMHIANDPALCSRLARVLRFVADWHRPCLASDTPATTEQTVAAAEMAKVEEVLSTVLLPGMMLVPAMTAVCSEVWAVLRSMPYTTRYHLYVQLRNSTATTPLLSASAKLASVELKKVLRRVHVPKDNRDRKEALKPFGRMLAKVAASNPLAVAQTMLAQVESYPNMVEPYVEALRFLTPLGFDVLTFTIIDRMSGSGRSKLKKDGVNISDWLSALCLFTGHAAKQFSGLDLVALAQYMANQLRAGEGLDLLLLKELVAIMTGLVTVTDVSADQVDAMAGGATLRSQALAFGAVRNPKQLSRGMARLLAALQQGPPEQQLVLPLLVLMGQQQQVIAVQMEQAHLKLVAELYDKAEQTLLQFGDFLQAAMTPDEYRAMLPSLETLVIEYGMDQEVAFQLYRPVFATIAPPPPPAAAVANSTALKDDAGAEEGEIEESPTKPAAAVPAVAKDPAEANADSRQQLTWAVVAASLRAVQPAPVWEAIGLELYFTFWSLSLYDIYVPVESYERERLRLEGQLRAKQDSVRNAQRDLDLAARGYAIDTALLAALPDVPTVQKEILRIQQTLEKLPAELQTQQRNHSAVSVRLETESATWLRGHTPGNNMSEMFILHCIMPRVKYSATDALYCAKFMKRMHELHTLNYTSITSYDKAIKDTVALVLCSTDAEANNLGIFLQHTLSLVSRWRADARLYAAECSSSPCFSATYASSVDQRTSFMDFRKLTYKWQMRLAKAFKTALDSGEYVQIRNALIVLSKLVQVFPEVKSAAMNMKSATARVRDGDKREDLRTLANMYHNSLSAQLTQRTVYETQQYQEDPAITTKRAAAAADAEVSAVRKAAEVEAAQGRAKRNRASAAASQEQAPKSSVGVRTAAEAAVGRQPVSGALREMPPSATSAARSPGSDAKAALHASGDRHGISKVSSATQVSKPGASGGAARPSSRDQAASEAGRDRGRQMKKVATKAPAEDDVATDRWHAKPDSSMAGDETTGEPKRTRSAAPAEKDARPISASRLRPDAPAFVQQEVTPHDVPRDKTRSAAVAAPVETQRPSKRIRTATAGVVLPGVKARVSGASGAAPGRAERVPSQEPSLQTEPSGVQDVAGVAAVLSIRASPAGGASSARPSATAGRIVSRPSKAEAPVAAMQTSEVLPDSLQSKQSHSDAPTASPPAATAAVSAAAAAKAPAAALAAENESTSVPQLRRKHAPVVFMRKDPRAAPTTPAGLPKRKREDLGGIPAAAAVITPSPVPPRVVQVDVKRAVTPRQVGRGDFSAAVPTTDAPAAGSLYSKSHRTELAERIRQLAPERMPEVERLMQNEGGTSAAGEDLSLSSVSPQTIATLTAMVDLGQELQNPKRSSSNRRSTERSEEFAEAAPRETAKQGKSAKSRKSSKNSKSTKGERHDIKKDRSNRRRKSRAASETEAVDPPDEEPVEEPDQAKATKHKSKKHKRDRDR